MNENKEESADERNAYCPRCKKLIGAEFDSGGCCNKCGRRIEWWNQYGQIQEPGAESLP